LFDCVSYLDQPMEITMISIDESKTNSER